MYRIEITFGHHRGDNTLLPVAQIETAEQRILMFFSQVFGGGQAYVCHRTGGYQTSDGLLITEPASIIWTFAFKMDDDVTKQLWFLASSMAEKLDQESVLLAITQIDGFLEFVPPTSVFQSVLLLQAT